MCEEFSLNDFPKEMLVEIMKYLDTTSFNILRMTNSSMAKKFSSRQPSINWVKIFQSEVATKFSSYCPGFDWIFNWSADCRYVKSDIRNRYFNCVHQALFDDHMYSFLYYYPKIMTFMTTMSDKNLNMTFITGMLHTKPNMTYIKNIFPKCLNISLRYAAAMGDAIVCWDMIKNSGIRWIITDPFVMFLSDNKLYFVQNELRIRIIGESMLRLLYPYLLLTKCLGPG